MIGCCCNMVGFAVASYRENKIGGLLAQGIGTSMLQVPNIVRKPIIWLPAILSSAILGPVGTMLANMQCNATGSGMGSAGFVGQIMTWETMVAYDSPMAVLIKIFAFAVYFAGSNHFIFLRTHEKERLDKIGRYETGNVRGQNKVGKPTSSNL